MVEIQGDEPSQVYIPDSLAEVFDRVLVSNNHVGSLTDRQYDAWFEGFIDGAVDVCLEVRLLL